MWGDATSDNSEAFLNGVNNPWVKDSNGDWIQDTSNKIRGDAASGGADLRNWVKGQGDGTFASSEYFTEWCSSYVTEILKSLAVNYDSTNDGPIMNAVQAMGSRSRPSLRLKTRI